MLSLPKHKFKNKLYALDASTIDLCLNVFLLGQTPCHASAGSATARGAVRLHVGLEHEGLLTTFMAITEGKTHNLTAARALQLPRGSIVVMDRGYHDDAWYNQLNDKDIAFVTRLKTNARYRIIER